jgi:hypothetical protein
LHPESTVGGQNPPASQLELNPVFKLSAEGQPVSVLNDSQNPLINQRLNDVRRSIRVS